MDSPATIGQPAYAVYGPRSGASRIRVTLTLVKLDGSPWANGDSVILSDGQVDTGSIDFKAGESIATAPYVPFSMGVKGLVGFNNRGWTDAPPFVFTVNPDTHGTIAVAAGIGL